MFGIPNPALVLPHSPLYGHVMTDTHADQNQLAKTFNPTDIETRWYKHWEESGAFRPDRPNAQPFTIVNPPPNVTGSLHIGHALDNTLQDIVIRYERLRGKDALWVVGTDHAGIATQMVVERQLEAQQDKRTNYTRDEFIAKVWEWKEESGGTITRQLRRLGCSMDWSREQFTMDPHFTKAVVKVFVDLYNQGLIYRDKRLVNWDPKLKTAISDLEVETTDVKGGFWHFKYPLADGVKTSEGKDYIVVATTRPETMLADMAVAVHPDDVRYQSVIGKDIVQPITGRRFKVVADEHADPELGSGAVKITPGHDFNDFEVGKRAGHKASDMLNMFDHEANVVQTSDGLIPAEFIGLHRFKKDGVDGARELVVARMKELGFLIPHVTKDKDGEEVSADFEPRTIATPFGDRGGVVVEPWLTDQWYVDAEKLAQGPIEAVRDGRIEIVPKSWEKTFFHWMENIQPWTISRQLWWGHQIPAWYGPSIDAYGHPNHGDVISVTPEFVAFKKEPIPGHVFVAEDESAVIEMAKQYYPEGYTVKTAADRQTRDLDQKNTIWLVRDSDVLDTWFSSALWPFATLGWPEQTDLLKRHYPNDLLISGFDILFFWDARMAMQGMHFLGEVPWKRLYLHGLVRAADGAKMSKSKGNVVDPLGLIDQYGADALRFFMAAMESQGRDIKMDERRVEGYRNFATKLWNACRFAQSNGIGASNSTAAPTATLPVNRWIIGEVVETVAALDKAMAALRFDDAANTIYHFVWDQFCDWYLELIKGQINDETKAVAGWVIDQILVMLHPFMPFITEELWHAMATSEGTTRPYDLILAEWPNPQAQVDASAKAEVEWLIKLTSDVRTAKNELGLAPGAKLPAWFPDESQRSVIEPKLASLERVARLSPIAFGAPPEGAYLQFVNQGVEVIVPLEGLIDIDAEKARLTKALDAASKEMKALEGRLGNPSFVEKAKPEAVEKARADMAEKAAEAERLQAALARLG